MKIEQGFLPLIFENDFIYLAEDVSTSIPSEQEADVKPLEEKPEVKEVKEETVEYKKEEASNAPVLVMVDATYGDKEKVLLQNILKALDVDISAVDIVKEHPEAFKPNNSIELFLCFDDSLVKNSQYELNVIHQTHIIYAHSLSRLDIEKPLKIQLWKLLKEMN